MSKCTKKITALVTKANEYRRKIAELAEFEFAKWCEDPYYENAVWRVNITFHPNGNSIANRPDIPVEEYNLHQMSQLISGMLDSYKVEIARIEAELEELVCAKDSEDSKHANFWGRGGF